MLNELALLTALNFTTIVVLAVSVFVYTKLIFQNYSNNESILSYVLKNNDIRTPFGYILLAIGLIIRLVFLLPIPIFVQANVVDLVILWESAIKAASQSVSAVFVWTGIGFALWPTIQKYQLKWFKEFSTSTGIIIYIVMVGVVFILGYNFHYLLFWLLDSHLPNP